MSYSKVKVYHRCGGCGKKQEFVNSGKFRVNANGNCIDVWLRNQAGILGSSSAEMKAFHLCMP